MAIKKVLKRHTQAPSMGTRAPPGLPTPNTSQQPSPAPVAETIVLPRHIYENLIKDSEELAGLKAILGANEAEDWTLMPGVDAETFAASGGRGTGANSNFAPDLRNALPQTNKTDKSLDLPCTVILHMRAPVTHAEVAAVVRGGTLTQIFLKRWNKEAHVSFVRGEDAAAFFEWAKNNDFRIQGKRAKVSWSQNSWKPAGYIRGQVEAGKLTRNILIQRAHSGVTEAAVRKQLEHIHNLEVLSVKVDGDEVRISTNCVQGALFAKTCMMSRSMYKGMWIGFYPDECAEPLPDTPGPGYINEPRSKAPVVPKGPLYNPYEVLSEDDMFPGETGSEGDDEHEEEETDDDF